MQGRFGLGRVPFTGPGEKQQYREQHKQDGHCEDESPAVLVVCNHAGRLDAPKTFRLSIKVNPVDLLNLLAVR